MITLGLQIVLLLFGLVGFGGAGAALAVSRCREREQQTTDPGLVGVAALLAVFAGLCTAIAVEPSGVFAFGGVVAWLSYVLMAQHLEIFRVERSVVPTDPRRSRSESRRIR